MKIDIISIGGAVEDLIFYTKEGVVLDNHRDPLRAKLLAFEYGAKLRIDEVRSALGGGAANVAVNASRLGLKSSVLVSLGLDQRGKKIIYNFRRQGVDLSLLKFSEKKETGFSFVIIGPEGEHVIFSDRGANRDLIITKQDVKKMSSAKYLYLTSFSGDSWKDILVKVFSVSGPAIAWNPGLEQLASFPAIKKYLTKTKILFLNHDEALELVVASGRKKNLDSYKKDIRKLLSFLFSLGPEIVVVTMGEKGAWAFEGRNYFFQEIIKSKKVVDTTGVGDAFNSSVVVGLELYQGNLKKALFLAAHNAASLVSQAGAQLGLLTKKDLKEIEKKFNKIKNKKYV